MYPLPILDIWDFDQTITIAHTAGIQEAFGPGNNTKSNLDEKIAHDDKRFCAVATFHQDPEYVLSYFLPLLKLTETDVETEKTETLAFKHHRLTKFYLKGRPQPFIIATPLLENYENNVKTIYIQGKNIMLESISTALPPCSEYHYYDDSERCYTKAREKGIFHCYYVDKDASRLSFKKEYHLTAAAELSVLLNAYKRLQEGLEIPSPNSETPLVALSFYSNKTVSDKGKDLELEQKADRGQLQAVNSLFAFINSSSTAEIEGLELLAEDELGLLIKDWETKNKVTLDQFVSRLREDRLAVEEYVSDDEHYENVEFLKLG
ncbi:hypothetical protein [Legionella micdadei]|uniref:Uncharacterized protein n=1 Tax=Legionella micdadei TaxID=451 RepID=A0A098GAB7_LEGMI|nr:hypothetical protein [Legionella micdadei]ARG96251.1 hypothetical protein B6N58_00285 [Legionella micdadei]ARG99007.1 hypothetical protein B6V88_00285 [Legionella micdadei]KTD29066.1 hypothetical protein Lmic_0986 [Legionella micdadei]NSL17274.1 hypothetical protein [Legionella micdadei]CEG59429.1 protein of unknown function [Legionella micdadei]